MKTEQDLNHFLEEFTENLKNANLKLNQSLWQLETLGSKEAADQVAKRSQELELVNCNKDNAEALIALKKEGSITSIDLLRTLNLLIKKHELAQAPQELIAEISEREAKLSYTYANFRTTYDGKETTENDLLELYKNEQDVEKRKAIWEASKKIGETLSEQIIDLVKKRNQLAHRLRYSDYYQMQLSYQEIDKKWLSTFLDDFNKASEPSYFNLLKEIEEELAENYQVKPSSIGPWAWSDPFCQEDPLAAANIDSLIEKVDILDAGKKFFKSMGFEVDDILQRSDLYERAGKNQHAFCINIDRNQDIRILTNLRPNIRWLETFLHELGHAVYEQGYDSTLSWYLKTPPHMITTEAMALITGRQAYDPSFLKSITSSDTMEESLSSVAKSQKRRQMIFSRWVLVMVHFESSMYANPDQDLNQLWWSTVQKYQGITPPSYRGGSADWACKYHIGLAPVYYHSYLLGEFLASMFKEHFEELNQSPSMFNHPNIRTFLQKKVFFPGNRLKWDRLIEYSMNRPLDFKPWVHQFGC